MFIPPVETAKGSQVFSLSYTIPSPGLIGQIKEKKVINVEWKEKKVSDTEVFVQGEWDLVFSYLTLATEPGRGALKVMQIKQPFSVTIGLERLSEAKVQQNDSGDGAEKKQDPYLEIVDLLWIAEPIIEGIELNAVKPADEPEDLQEKGNTPGPADKEAEETLFFTVRGELAVSLKQQKGQKINIRPNEGIQTHKREIFVGTPRVKSPWRGEIRAPKDRGGEALSWNRLSWHKGKRKYF